MTIHVHRLDGCAPAPLAWYLKGLAVLRLVAEQIDAEARGFWRDEAFHLVTSLDRRELELFFLERYEPTALVDPWNKDSGFYAENEKGVGPMERSRANRLAGYRAAIREARALVAGLGAPKASLAELKENLAERKTDLIGSCARTWRGGPRRWLDASVSIDALGKAAYPSLLGSGGNDGRLDFPNNFMQRIQELMDVSDEAGRPSAAAEQWLSGALWADCVPGLQKNAIGQFLPGYAGGANSTTGPDGESQLNPWDFVLALEGSLLFAASSQRRLVSGGAAAIAAPFSVRSSAVGYASAAQVEDVKRGEQWMPLWDGAATLGEVEKLLSEGRIQLARSSATTAIDVARAVARLGTARGVGAFQRYGFIERNGKSCFATPLGRWTVAEQPRQELLDDIAPWLEELRRAARNDRAPASFGQAVRVVDEAVLGVCSAGAEAFRWRALLAALGEVERRMVASPGFTAKSRLRPIPCLRGAWVEASDDGGPAIALALAFASQGARPPGADPVRQHWMPLAGQRFAADGETLRKDPRVVCHGLDPWADCVALVRRRLVEGGSGALAALPLVAPPQRCAVLAEVHSLLAGEVDLGDVLGLSRALMAVPLRERTHVRRPVGETRAISPLYALFRLSCLPFNLELGAASIAVPPSRAVFERLASGDIAGGAELAIRSLRARGLAPALRRAAGDPELARRLAASLAFPISSRSATMLAELLIAPQQESDHVR